MYKDYILVAVILMGMMYIITVWVTFGDLLGVLLKIFPLRKPRGYELHEKFYHSKEYKRHKKKWIKIHLSLFPVYILLVWILTWLLNVIGFVLSLCVFAFGYGIIENRETKERRKIKRDFSMSLIKNEA